MKKGIVFLLLSMLSPVFAYSMDAKTILKNYEKCVVLIKTDKGTGTGFFINEYGTIVTANHVVKDASSIQVKYNDKWIEALEIDNDEKTDQAKIQIMESNTPYVNVTKEKPEKLDKITVLGYPLGIEELNVNTGNVSAIYVVKGKDLGISGSSAEEEHHYICQTDTVVNPGNSGGPAFDTQGRVFGVVTSKIDSTKFKNVSGMNFINSISLNENKLLFESECSKKFLNNKTKKGTPTIFTLENRLLIGLVEKVKSFNKSKGIITSAYSEYKEFGTINYSDVFVYNMLNKYEDFHIIYILENDNVYYHLSIFMSGYLYREQDILNVKKMLPFLYRTTTNQKLKDELTERVGSK